MTGVKTRFARFRTAGAVAGMTVAAIVATAIPGIGVTNASWTNNEWDTATAGVLNCTNATDFATRGAGQLISGTLLSTNLSALAEVRGVTVTNPGTGSVVVPVSAQSLGSNAYANPLDVGVIGTTNHTALINAAIGPIALPLNTTTGVVNQYGRASNNGTSAGAAGVVNNSGAIGLTATAPGPGVPTFATLDLASVLGSLGLSGTANLTDVSLALGAVASSATLDACNADWTKNLAANLARNYVAAGLSANVNSPLVGQLTSTVNTTLTTLQTNVNALAGNSGVINSITSGVLGTITPLLSGLGLGTPSVTLSANIDLSTVASLLTTDIGDGQGIADINLADGTITVNLAKLFNGTNGLNNQAPNTELLINAADINTLTARLTTALAGLVTNLTSRLTTALGAVTLNVHVVLPVVGTNLGSIDIGGNNVSLASLTAGTAALHAVYTAGTGCPANIGTAAVCALAATVAGVIDLVTAGTIGPLLATAIGPTLNTILSPTIVTGLTTSLQGITAPLVTVIGATLNGLFGPTSALSIAINAQNSPIPANANPLPAWAAGLPGPASSPYSTGQYDISALRIVVLGAVGGGIAVDLARSSVGSNTLVP